MKRALLLNASAVVAFHNHPSGNPEPSTADRAITVHIKQALALVEVRLLDHIVVSAEGYTSLAMRGWAEDLASARAIEIIKPWFDRRVVQSDR